MRYVVRLVFTLFFVFAPFFYLLFAQVQFCDGIKGEEIFVENFGQGVGIGDPLPLNSTSYTYTLNFPEENQYTIRSNSLPNTETLPDPDTWLWHILTEDISSSLGFDPGKMLLINATDNSNICYKSEVEGLCEYTNYEFSFWTAPLYNINSGLCIENGGIGVPVNLRFEVWNQDETQLISSAETGNIDNTSSIAFQQFGLSFTTGAGQTSVNIKILNNIQQIGCGNDFVLDEIKVQLCGGVSELTSVVYGTEEPTFCVDDPLRIITLKMESFDNLGYFIWQRSSDGVNWENIDEIIYPNSQGIFLLDIPEIFNTTYFRTVFASTEENLLDSERHCTWSTNTYIVYIISNTDSPLTFSNEISYCGDSVIPALAVIPVPNLMVNWYDSPVGGNLLYENSFNFVPSGPGVYYAGYTSEEFPCIGDIRTPITLIWEPGIMVSTNPDPIIICGDEGVVLDAVHPNSIYQWDPSSLGDEQTATVYEPGLYVVTIRDPQSACNEARTRTFIVEGFINPEINEIIHAGSDLVVTMVYEDEYEYSLDGVSWQFSNVFQNVGTGLFTIYVRDIIDCGSDYEEYLVLNLPQFFTPNGDGFNDTLKIDFIGELNLEVWIFDRYGKLLSILNSSNPEWDGTYNGINLVGTDYWFILFKDGVIFKSGHFSLKR